MNKRKEIVSIEILPGVFLYTFRIVRWVFAINKDSVIQRRFQRLDPFEKKEALLYARAATRIRDKRDPDGPCRGSLIYIRQR